MGKYKVVVLDKLLPLTDIERDILRDAGASVLQFDVATPEAIAEVAGDADAIMTVGVKISPEVLDRLPNLKVIGRYGIGLDNINLAGATERNVVVTYAPVYCQDEVATMTLCLMLACERRLLQADKVVKGGNWKGSLRASAGARSTKGKVFGLVGFGSIARKVVPLVKPLGVKVIASDPYVDAKLAEELDVELVELDYLLEHSDYVSLHAPLLAGTRHMIDEAQLASMKKEAILINTGRGGLVNQKALFAALRDGVIAAAGIDVLEEEPPQGDDPIFTLDNVITSGHIAAATEESVARLRQIVAQGVADVLSGRWPEFVGNPEVRERVSLQ